MATTKKTTATKKVEAPIDQRETFVSLQKNFSDSDMPVEEKLKTLYQLQAADSEIDKTIRRCVEKKAIFNEKNFSPF